jgi:hypothetical protein
MRTLFLSRDHAHFDFSEVVFFKKLMQLHFAKSEPVVRVQLACSFKPMVLKIENHQPTSAF